MRAASLILCLIAAQGAMATADAQTIHDFDLQWNYSKPAETEAKFRALLDKPSAKGEYRLELLTQIARAQGLQRKFSEAHRTLDEVEEALPQSSDRVKVRYLLERGRVFNSLGDPDQAGPLFVEAWDLARSIREDFFAVDAAHMVAIVEPTERQLEWNLKAVALAEISKDERARGWMGSLYNNIGWTYFDQKEYEMAVDSFERALTARRHQGKREPILIARWCVAKAWRMLGRLDEALKEQQLLEKEHAKDRSPDPYVQEELGELYLAKGKADEAAAHFAKAYKELSKDEWFVKNEAARLERIKKMGRIGV